MPGLKSARAVALFLSLLRLLLHLGAAVPLADLALLTDPPGVGVSFLLLLAPPRHYPVWDRLLRSAV